MSCVVRLWGSIVNALWTIATALIFQKDTKKQVKIPVFVDQLPHN